MRETMANDKVLLVDADVLTYSVGGLKNQDGEPEGWPIVVTMLDTMIENMMRSTGCTTVRLFITSDDKSNFRIKKATIAPYKGHRKSEKPYHYQSIRNFLKESREAIEVHNMEADDELGILLTELGDKAVLASIDKDLDMIPGWHWNWSKQSKYLVKEVPALRSFYKQLLTGDPTDNILGLYGVGKASSLLGKVEECYNELDMYNLVKEQYEKRFGSYWRMFMWENAELLWIKRTRQENELQERFENLERLSIDQNLNQPLDIN